ncbi:MAG TPA: UDP-N-acetylglucosamine 2-epimerase (non-hydrolyzing) [Gemmatimonadales bacterium]|nr:UDP-N-acetylglucosamine 2-epimerase (non-hydrolyzing) [Gemmatimonadales bacterium]
MKIASIVGARPQFIKAAMVSHSLGLLPDVQEVLVHTGQHYDPMLNDIFFAELELAQPAYNLDVRSGPHGAQTGRMLERIEAVLEQEAPNWVVVYGDTNSTLAGALAAIKLHLKVAHVEAGLRSFDRRMPEEINRVLTDHASDLLLAPTASAVHNLRQEGVPEHRVHLVGDVMYDAAREHTARALRVSTVLDRLGLRPRGYVLATIHRAGSTDDEPTMRAIFQGLLEVTTAIPVVLPLHPRTRKSLGDAGMLNAVEQGLRVVEPVGYLDMLVLEHYACLIATDSGGVQKEAFFQGVPCVTLRAETEWTELVDSGWNRLVPPSAGDVGTGILSALAEKRPDERPDNIFGDGNAARYITQLLVNSA